LLLLLIAAAQIAINCYLSSAAQGTAEPLPDPVFSCLLEEKPVFLDDFELRKLVAFAAPKKRSSG
jgi:hypothetical protein